jgi:hypothetical protein
VYSQAIACAGVQQAVAAREHWKQKQLRRVLVLQCKRGLPFLQHAAAVEPIVSENAYTDCLWRFASASLRLLGRCACGYETRALDATAASSTGRPQGVHAVPTWPLQRTVPQVDEAVVSKCF